MRFPFLLVFAALTLGAQAPQGPNLDAQRDAMKKLGFLAGKWSGNGTVTRGAGEMKLIQSEDVQYKLDGLVMALCGAGCASLFGCFLAAGSNTSSPAERAIAPGQRRLRPRARGDE